MKNPRLKISQFQAIRRHLLLYLLKEEEEISAKSLNLWQTSLHMKDFLQSGGRLATILVHFRLDLVVKSCGKIQVFYYEIQYAAIFCHRFGGEVTFSLLKSEPHRDFFLDFNR